jgi:hypothetical protein
MLDSRQRAALDSQELLLRADLNSKTSLAHLSISVTHESYRLKVDRQRTQGAAQATSKSRHAGNFSRPKRCLGASQL